MCLILSVEKNFQYSYEDRLISIPMKLKNSKIHFFAVHLSQQKYFWKPRTKNSNKTSFNLQSFTVNNPSPKGTWS